MVPGEPVMTDREGIVVIVRATEPHAWVDARCIPCHLQVAGHPRRGEDIAHAVDRLVDRLYEVSRYSCAHDVIETRHVAAHEQSPQSEPVSRPAASPPAGEPGVSPAGRAPIPAGRSLASGPYRPVEEGASE